MARPQPGLVCGANGCEASAVRQARNVPLCLAHFRRVEWQLDALGTTLQLFAGNVLDLLEQGGANPSDPAIASESRIARKKARQARGSIVTRKINALELELRFAEAQFDAVSSTAPAHKTSDLAGRLWQLQHRIDDLRAQIAKLKTEPGGLTG